MAFFKQALLRAENILEQVDESVVRASKRLTIDGSVLTGDEFRRNGEDLDGDEDSVEDQFRIGDGDSRLGLRNIISAEERREFTRAKVDLENREQKGSQGHEEESETAPQKDSREIKEDGDDAETAEGHVGENGEQNDEDRRTENHEHVLVENSTDLDHKAVSSSKFLQEGNTPKSGHEDVEKEWVSFLEEERAALRRDLKIAEEELTLLNAAVESMKGRMKGVLRLESEVKSLESKSLRLEEEIEKIKEDYAAAEKRLGVAGEEKENLELKVQVLEGELESLRENFKLAGERGDETVDGARREAVEAVLAHEREIASHNETRLKMQKRIEKLESEAASGGEIIADAERRADDARRSLEKVEGQLRETMQERDGASRRAMELEQKAHQFERAQKLEEELVATKVALEARVQGLETEIEYKRAEVTTANHEAKTLREALESARRLNSRDGADGDAMAVEQVQAQLRIMTDSTMRIQGETELLRGENRALKLQLDTERRRTIEAQAMAATTSRGGDVGHGRDAPRRSGVVPLRPPRQWPGVVKTTVAGLDSLSATLVLFLRREPVFRIALIVYIMFMHIFIYMLLHSGVSSEHKHFDFASGAHFHSRPTTH